VIPLHEAREENGLLYLVMRYVDGSDLATALREEGRVAPRRALAIVEQVAAALDAAHEQGLVHRDVKPANVLLEPTPSGAEHAYLTDFGLVKDVSSDSSLSVTGVFVGTYQYAAPEQIDPTGGKSVDRRTDVYALGCVLFHVLSGQVPFPRPNLQALIAAHLFMDPPDVCATCPELPPQLGRVIQRAMAKEQDGRYYTAGQLARAARQAFEAEPAAPPPPPPPLRRLEPPPPPPTAQIPARGAQIPARGAAGLTLLAAALTALGSLAAIASLFAPWHTWTSVDTGSPQDVTGWEAFGVGDLAILAAALVAVACAAAVVRGFGPRLPLAVLAALCGVGVLFVAVYVAFWDPQAHELVVGQTGPTERGPGPLVAAAAGLVMAAGGALAARRPR
jgi:serine/threonine protein kinase